jgi:uncharacterized protein YfdQ (DUF2303 family)
LEQDMELNGVAAIIKEAHGSKNGMSIDTADGGKKFIVADGFKLADIPALNPVLPGFVADTKTLVEQKSFEAFTKRFATKNTVILADPSTALMAARIDYHAEAGGAAPMPGRDLHRVIFDCGFDENWKRWREINGKTLAQVDFAYFIEEMLHTIAEPDGADLLEMAQTLKINRGVVFKSNTRLADGTVDIAYEEKDIAMGKGGKLAVPENLTLVTPIFMMRGAISVKVNLRYKVEKGEPLQFVLQILNIKLVELGEFKVMSEEIADATGCPVYFART